MSARLERQRRRRRRGGAARVIIITISVLIACSVIGVLSAVGYVVGLANSAPDLASLRAQDPGRLSTVYAADGQKLGTIQNDVLRAPIASKEMPQNVRDATVAIEDQRFYQHKGVDFEGVIRAALKNATSGKTVQGGSTLTMQLIRNLYISGERTFQRKVREAKLAEELENVHPGRAGKEWILTKYLNSVPYGTNGGQTAVGIQAAARAFFDKPASELNSRRPRCSPACRRRRAPTTRSASRPARPRRRNDVLRKMRDEGYISAGAAQDAIGAPLNLHPNGYFQQKRESYFFDYVTDELIKEYGIKTVRSGGLRIKTTIDLDLQKKARAAIAKSLNFPGAPSSAIVSIDPANGYIRTMASSAKYKDSKFNLAADAKRQPGSAFKVMALVAAVNAGVNPATTSYPSGRFDQDRPGVGPDRRQLLRRALLGRLEEPHRRDAELRQHGLHPPRARHRPEAGQGGRPRPRHHLQAPGLPGRDARRPAPLLLAAGDGQRLRDDRLRRLAQQAQGDHGGALPRRQGRRPLQADPPQGVRLGRDVRGARRSSSRTSRAEPASARTSAAPRAARPARRTRTRTPGSSASRRSSRRRRGSASRRATSRCRTSSTADRSTAARSRPRSGATT